MMGGLSTLVSGELKRLGLLQRFEFVVNREHQRVFSKLNGIDLPFLLPNASIPRTGDFSDCS
jgi:hypothetical protein